MNARRYLSLIVIIGILQGCSAPKELQVKPATRIGSLKFLGERIITSAQSLNGTTIGGLSGIDYDPIYDIYYLICDDPSAISSARFYTANISLSENGIDSVKFKDVFTVTGPDNKPYPDIRVDRIHSADIEAMRYNPMRKELIRTTEGQRVIRGDTIQLQDPQIVIMGMKGEYRDTLPLPANMHIRATENGPRHNSVFEGITFGRGFKDVYVSVEDAIYEDGPKAGLNDSTAWIRVIKFDRKKRKQTAQYGYSVDPVPYPAQPAGAFKINGVTDILDVGNNQFIFIERAWSTGQIPSDIRIYLGDLSTATNVMDTRSLLNNTSFKPITKRLLFNFESLGRMIYNIEGVTFGPKLPNGNKTLIFISDDNFNPKERTQLLLFEVIP